MTSVSNIIYNKLKGLGVKTVFGYTGGAILPVINQFYKSQTPKLIVPKTEWGASFMAEGYAKMHLNKKPGVVIATSGPGATNLVTSLQNALMDGTPLVAFTGQVSTSSLGSDAFQEADIINITSSCTKWNTMLKNENDIEYLLDKGFDICLSGRPGPVLIDLPKNLTSMNTSKKTNKNKKDKWLKKENLNEILSDEIINDIRNSKNPVIISGQGTLDNTEDLRLFAKNHNIPVSTTLLGLGGVNESEKGSLEMLGMHGSYTANTIVQKADLILVLGARLDDRVTGKMDSFGKMSKRIIHVDIRLSNKERTVKGTTFINSDVKNILTQLNNVEPKKELVENRKKWIKYIEVMRKNNPFYVNNNKKILNGSKILNELNNIITENKDKKYCIVADVGVHQMLAAQHIKYDFPRVRYITSGGLGTMGFSLPAAMGAKLANPDYEVICVIGDGGFNMSLHELRTLYDNNINIKIIVINNGCQQMVKMWQNYFYEERYIGVDNDNPKYDKVAESLGVKGIRIDANSNVKKVLRNVLQDNNSIVIDAITSKDEYVFPMVLPGKGLDEMILK